MKVQLKQNWAGYPPGKIVSVSEKRASYLVDELKVGRYTREQLAINKVAAAEKVKSVKAKIAKGSK